MRSLIAGVLSVVSLLHLSAAENQAAVATITPAAWLQAQAKPHFRPGHGLPRLTRYGWILPVDARIAVTEQWGYALEFCGYLDQDVLARLDQPGEMRHGEKGQCLVGRRPRDIGRPTNQAPGP